MTGTAKETVTRSTSSKVDLPVVKAAATAIIEALEALAGPDRAVVKHIIESHSFVMLSDWADEVP